MSESILDLYDSAQVAIHKREYELAHGHLMAILNKDNKFADAYFLLARIAHDFKSYEKEIELLLKAIDLDEKNAEYCAYLAKAFVVKGDVQNGLVYAQRSAALPDHTAFSFDTLGVVYNRLSLYAEASEFFKKAVVLEKNNPAIYFNLGSTLKFCGDFSGARYAYEKAIDLNPSYYKAHAALTSLGDIAAEKSHVERLKKLLPDAKNADDYLHISHAISKELEAVGYYEKSFRFLNDAKQRKLQELHYDIAMDASVFDQLKKRFSNKKVVVENGYNAKGPIFVVGMPRSGTTLVERIISSHSRVSTAGELHNFSVSLKELLGDKSNNLINSELIQASQNVDFKQLGEAYLKSTQHLTQGREYLVDKLPLNVLYAGFIANALPKARIICLDRNPLDTIVSNYRQLFSFHDLTYAYSLSLSTTAQYYIEFKKLTQFWRDRYPENFYVVNYEKLVTNPETEIRNLLRFCELEWEQECLHIEKNSKPVATASSVQVRKPISDSSIGQWKNYDAHLADVKSLLETVKL